MPYTIYIYSENQNQNKFNKETNECVFQRYLPVYINSNSTMVPQLDLILKSNIWDLHNIILEDTTKNKINRAHL